MDFMLGSGEECTLDADVPPKSLSRLLSSMPHFLQNGMKRCSFKFVRFRPRNLLLGTILMPTLSRTIMLIIISLLR